MEIATPEAKCLLEYLEYYCYITYSNYKCSFFFFFTMPAACGSSWARNPTCAIAATQAAAVTTSDL